MTGLNFVCASMADSYKDKGVNVVLGAAVGGILISGGVGRELNVKHIFTERVNGIMELRRGFDINEDSKILIVEDIVTTGGSINEIINLIEKYKANITGIVSIVDRNEKKSIFKYY